MQKRSLTFGIITLLLGSVKKFSVSFCTKGPVCKIWQHLEAGIAICVLGLVFKGDLEPAVAAGGSSQRGNHLFVILDSTILKYVAVKRVIKNSSVGF